MKTFVADTELIAEWDWESNTAQGLDPHILSHGSTKRVGWICSKGHNYMARIDHRFIMGSGCPYCAGKMPIVGENDLATTNPDLAKEWHPTKNNLLPYQLKAGSSKKVWWLCPHCGHEYQATVYSRVKGGGCPNCVYTNKTSYPEQALFYYVKQIYPDAINRYKANFLGKMELDIFIPSLNYAIEYDGAHWHNEKTLRKEQKKYKLCRKENIKLIRVREKLPSLTSDVADYQIEVVKVDNKINLEETIKELIQYITFFRKGTNINLKKDEKSIRESYQRKPKDSLYNLYPKIAREWHPTKNGHLKPDQFKKFRI